MLKHVHSIFDPLYLKMLNLNDTLRMLKVEDLLWASSLTYSFSLPPLLKCLRPIYIWTKWFSRIYIRQEFRSFTETGSRIFSLFIHVLKNLYRFSVRCTNIWGSHSCRWSTGKRSCCWGNIQALAGIEQSAFPALFQLLWQHSSTRKSGSSGGNSNCPISATSNLKIKSLSFFMMRKEGVGERREC